MPGERTRTDKWDLRHPFTAERPKLLLVEGEDEWHLLIRLLPQIDIADMDVRSFGGNSKLGAALGALGEGTATGFDFITSLGIWRDAESDVVQAKRDVVNALEHSGFAAPPEPGQFTDEGRRIGYFILPDANRPGCFEDVCLSCVQEDPAYPCLEEYTRCLQAQAEGGLLRLDLNLSKTKIHAFLASREDATVQMGQALDLGCWDWNHRAWQPLIEFLKSM